MKKINIIKKSNDINNVINEGERYKNKYFYIYNKDNNVSNYRFVICVSKKIGNAVRRNKLKRQIKDIIDKSNFVFKSNKDYVIIVKGEINTLNYQQIKDNLNELLSKIID